ncbi:MAG TPA: hypothetical protein VGL24_10435, partial [Chthoniobacterales bacterium]
MRDLRRRVDAEDAEGFIRPAGRFLRTIFPIRQVNFPASHVRDPLREGKVGFTLADLFVGLLLLTGVGRHDQPRGTLPKGDRGGMNEDENERAILAQVAPAAAEARSIHLPQHLDELFHVGRRPNVT